MVFADRDMRSVVQKDIGGLENRVREETELQSISVGSRFER